MSQCGPPAGLPGSEERYAGTQTPTRSRDDAREQLRSVLTSLPIVLWSYDAGGVLTLSEGQGLQALGMKPGDFVGRSLRELYADFPDILQAIERGLRGETFSVELEFMGAWFDVRFLPERGPDGEVAAVSGLALNITERRRAEEDLRQSETRYRLATLATSDTVWDWDLSTNLVHWSENIHRLTGVAPGEVDPALEWWAGRLHPEDRERVVRGLHAVIDGDGAHWTDEYRFRRVDGSYIIINDRGYVVRDTRGKAVRMVGALLDITGRKVAEQEARRRAEFEQHLIGIVSHDLRNPINAITMAAGLVLKQDHLSEAQQRSLRRIVSSAERATRLLRDLLDFTQARLKGALPVALGPMNLHELARQVVEEVQVTHPDRCLVLEQTGDGQGEWDADRLAQLIINLVNNALTYSEAHCAVRVSTRGRRDMVALSVHNTGKPIPTGLLPRLFEPLKRGESKDAKSTHSIGLGLFIVKHIVDAHGGSIRVHSTLAHGTTFTVRLPRYPAKGAPARAPRAPAPAPPPAARPPK
jgi:PAS domain S-box-containing protein